MIFNVSFEVAWLFGVTYQLGRREDGAIRILQFQALPEFFDFTPSFHLKRPEFSSIVLFALMYTPSVLGIELNTHAIYYVSLWYPHVAVSPEPTATSDGACLLMVGGENVRYKQKPSQQSLYTRVGYRVGEICAETIYTLLFALEQLQ